MQRKKGEGTIAAPSPAVGASTRGGGAGGSPAYSADFRIVSEGCWGLVGIAPNGELVVIHGVLGTQGACFRRACRLACIRCIDAPRPVGGCAAWWCRSLPQTHASRQHEFTNGFRTSCNINRLHHRLSPNPPTMPKT